MSCWRRCSSAASSSQKTPSALVRFTGCPVSVAEQVLFLVELGGLKSPFMNPETAIQTTKNYLIWRSATAIKRLRGQPYQRPGPCQRGNAKPDEKALRDAATPTE